MTSSTARDLFDARFRWVILQSLHVLWVQVRDRDAAEGEEMLAGLDGLYEDIKPLVKSQAEKIAREEAAEVTWYHVKAAADLVVEQLLLIDVERSPGSAGSRDSGSSEGPGASRAKGSKDSDPEKTP